MKKLIVIIALIVICFVSGALVDKAPWPVFLFSGIVVGVLARVIEEV